MKRQYIFFIFTWFFSILHAGEPMEAEKMPEFFYLAVWHRLWEAHKESDHIPLTSDDSPLIITTFVPLHTEKRQVQSYLHRLNEASHVPCIVLKVKTNVLCSVNEIPHIFSKDRFGYYRFNATIIPTQAIIEAEIMPSNSV